MRVTRFSTKTTKTSASDAATEEPHAPSTQSSRARGQRSELRVPRSDGLLVSEGEWADGVAPWMLGHHGCGRKRCAPAEEAERVAVEIARRRGVGVAQSGATDVEHAGDADGARLDELDRRVVRVGDDEGGRDALILGGETGGEMGGDRGRRDGRR